MVLVERFGDNRRSGIGEKRERRIEKVEKEEKKRNKREEEGSTVVVYVTLYKTFPLPHPSLWEKKGIEGYINREKLINFHI